MLGFILLGAVLLLALRNSPTSWLGAIFILIGVLWFLARLTGGRKTTSAGQTKLTQLVRQEVESREPLQLIVVAHSAEWPAPWKGEKGEEPDLVGLGFTARRLFLVPVKLVGLFHSRRMLLPQRSSALKSVQLQELGETGAGLDISLRLNGQTLELILPANPAGHQAKERLKGIDDELSQVSLRS
jgi:hypothetical protein